uniref:Uncharacterized protein n=1 Tax=Heterorhabditis bacteriophora TaxID=37862 RepID=A0A1I7XCJ1_HETBA
MIIIIIIIIIYWFVEQTYWQTQDRNWLSGSNLGRLNQLPPTKEVTTI